MEANQLENLLKRIRNSCNYLKSPFNSLSNEEAVLELKSVLSDIKVAKQWLLLSKNEVGFNDIELVEDSINKLIDISTL